MKLRGVPVLGVGMLDLYSLRKTWAVGMSGSSPRVALAPGLRRQKIEWLTLWAHCHLPPQEHLLPRRVARTR